MKETEIPTTVEVRYETWSPDEVSSEAKFLTEADDGGIVMAVLGVKHPGLQEKGAMVLVQQQENYHMVAVDSEAVFTPKVRHKVRLVRKEDLVTLFLDGEEVVPGARLFRDSPPRPEAAPGGCVGQRRVGCFISTTLRSACPAIMAMSAFPLAPQQPDAL